MCQCVMICVIVVQICFREIKFAHESIISCLLLFWTRLEMEMDEIKEQYEEIRKPSSAINAKK